MSRTIVSSLAGLALVAWPGSARRALAAGVVLGLASVTRHDGVIFAVVAAVAVPQATAPRAGDRR